LRQQFENPDKNIADNKEEDPIHLVEKAARSGSWILISTIKFPQFWKKITQKLDEIGSNIDD